MLGNAVFFSSQKGNMTEVSLGGSLFHFFTPVYCDFKVI